MNQDLFIIGRKASNIVVIFILKTHMTQTLTSTFLAHQI